MALLRYDFPLSAWYVSHKSSPIMICNDSRIPVDEQTLPNDLSKLVRHKHKPGVSLTGHPDPTLYESIRAVALPLTTSFPS
jgi:hypothetical protein